MVSTSAPATWLAIGALEMMLTLGLLVLAGAMTRFNPSMIGLLPAFFIAGTVCAWLLGRLFAWRDRGSESTLARAEP